MKDDGYNDSRGATQQTASGKVDGYKLAQEPLAPLIKLLSKLPGLGPRSARRAVIHLLQSKENLMMPLAAEMQKAVEGIESCTTCGNLDLKSPCHICTHHVRDQSILCVVESVADLWALERNAVFKGQFHVLGGNLSALDGVGPDDLRIKELMDRLKQGTIQEIILALSATIDGQTTAHYIQDQIKDLEREQGLENTITVTAIAHGVPVGGELDYLDEGTLSTALKSRRSF